MLILVTGAYGQLGRALRELRPDWLYADHAALDITSAEAVAAFFERNRPDVIVNAAAYTDVDGAETHRDEAFAVNAEGPHLLAWAALKTDTALIHISTDFVFDGRRADSDLSHTPQPRTVPYSELDTPHPLNVYGESKLAGESAVIAANPRGAVVRTSWLWSPVGHNFVTSILAAATRAIATDPQHAEIRVVSDQIGTPTSASSLASAIIRMTSQPPEHTELFHYCDGPVISRAEFASRIISDAGLPCRVIPVSMEEYTRSVEQNNSAAAFRLAKRPSYSALDPSKFTRTYINKFDFLSINNYGR